MVSVPSLSVTRDPIIHLWLIMLSCLMDYIHHNSDDLFPVTSHVHPSASHPRHRLIRPVDHSRHVVRVYPPVSPRSSYKGDTASRRLTGRTRTRRLSPCLRRHSRPCRSSLLRHQTADLGSLSSGGRIRCSPSTGSWTCPWACPFQTLA